VLKQKRALLDKEDAQKNAQDFVDRYIKTVNDGGIIGIDTSEDYIPINQSGMPVNALQMREIRENVYRYYGVSEAILKSDFTEQQWTAFYESVLEPIAIQLSQEFTIKCFTDRGRGWGNEITFNSSRLKYAGMTGKIQLMTLASNIGLMTVNEMRVDLLNMPPLDEGGDTRLVSLNYVNASKQDLYQVGKPDGEEGDSGQETDDPGAADADPGTGDGGGSG